MLCGSEPRKAKVHRRTCTLGCCGTVCRLPGNLAAVSSVAGCWIRAGSKAVLNEAAQMYRALVASTRRLRSWTESRRQAGDFWATIASSMAATGALWCQPQRAAHGQGSRSAWWSEHSSGWFWTEAERFCCWSRSSRRFCSLAEFGPGIVCRP